MVFDRFPYIPIQKIYSRNYIQRHLSRDHTHFTARWNLHSCVIYTIYHLQMHIFDDQKMEAPAFYCWFISFIYFGNSLFQGFQRKIGCWKIHLQANFQVDMVQRSKQLYPWLPKLLLVEETVPLCHHLLAAPWILDFIFCSLFLSNFNIFVFSQHKHNGKQEHHLNPRGWGQP